MHDKLNVGLNTNKYVRLPYPSALHRIDLHNEISFVSEQQLQQNGNPTHIILGAEKLKEGLETSTCHNSIKLMRTKGDKPYG